MNMERVVEILKVEKGCVERQGTQRCSNRDCGNCDLLLPTEDVLKAYTLAIGCIEGCMADEVPFITGLSADSADVPECKTWSSCNTCEHEGEKDGSNCYECINDIENKYTPKEVTYAQLEYNQAYPFIDKDGRHYRVSYVHTKIYADEEKPEHFSSNTNELVRDCDNCTQ